MTRRRMILIGLAVIGADVLLIVVALFGSYYLALDALHNHANLTVAQACQHWSWIHAATADDGTPALHAAVGRTLAQLGCPR